MECRDHLKEVSTRRLEGPDFDRLGIRHPGTFAAIQRLSSSNKATMEEIMDLGKGALLWLLGVPLPIIILLVLFWHH